MITDIEKLKDSDFMLYDHSLYKKALLKFGEDSLAVYVMYDDYGGRLEDRAIIEFYKANMPDNIVYSYLSRNGQNAIIQIDKGKYKEGQTIRWDLEDEIEDFYRDMAFKMTDAEAHSCCQEYGSDIVYNEICTWFENYGKYNANEIDYNPRELDEYVVPLIVDNLCSQIKKKIVEEELCSIIKQLDKRKWKEGAYDQSKFELIENTIELLDKFIKEL